MIEPGLNHVSTPFGNFLREVGEECAGTRNHVPSPSLTRENWRRLFKSVTPVENESLRGLVYRACSLNSLPNVWGLLKWMGLSHRNRVLVAEDPNIAISELAYAMGVDEKEIVLRRYLGLGDKRRLFFGLEVQPSSIETRIRRFSPEAFRADVVEAAGPLGGTDSMPSIAPCHRATWELRDIPFDLGNWDLLQDTCWCEAGGIAQRWTRTATHIHECDRCGDPLANLESFFVPDDMRSALSILRALVAPDEAVRRNAATDLPEVVRDADRSRTFALIARMARAIDPVAAERSIEQPRLKVRGLWQACDALLHWPHGIKTLKWAPNLPQPVVVSITKAWSSLVCTDQACPPFYRVRTAHDVHIISTSPAVKRYKLSPETLHWAHDTKRLTQHHLRHGDRLVPAFDAREVAAFSDEWRSRVSLRSFAYELGISLHGAEQLVALGIIAAEAPALPDTGRYCHPEAVDNFMNAIEAAAARNSDSKRRKGVSIQNSVSLAEAMRWVTGRAKPYGPAIALLLNGEIPFTIQAAPRFVESIAVSSEQIPTIAALRFDRSNFPDFEFSERIIQHDALNMLNINVGANGPRVLKTLPSKGAKPITYRVADVERLARDFVTLPEIAMRLGMLAGATYLYLCKAGKAETTPGLWSRKILEELT